MAMVMEVNRWRGCISHGKFVGRVLWGAVVFGILAIVLLPVRHAQAQPVTLPLVHQTALRLPDTRDLEIPVNKSRVIRTNVPVRKVSVGNPNIADIVVLRSEEVYVVGKQLGTTNVTLWDRHGHLIQTVDLEVTYDLDTLKSKLHELLPNEHIGVHSSQGDIVLSGEVSSSPKMNAALQLADSFVQSGHGSKGEKGQSGGKVINFMQVGGAQQVMLEVKVAEMQRQLVRQLDTEFNFLHFGNHFKGGAVSGGAAFPPVRGGAPVFSGGTPIGPSVTQFSPNVLTIADKGLFASLLSGRILFNSVINAAKQHGLAKILAEPNLTTLTGQEANFLSGGEFPIPVPQQNGAVTIEYKKFGISLQFLPVVLDSGRINIKINVSVSELTNANAEAVGIPNSNQGLFVPALTERSADATVELKDGQTLGIAGLISEDERADVNKFPGLGDVPILGQLFRSQQFVDGKTELVIFVTPHFARPIAKNMVKLPTAAFVAPSDIGFYLLGRIQGHAKPQASSAGAPGQGGLEGKFGQVLPGD